MVLIKMGKGKIKYQEKYKKGNVIDKTKTLHLLTENIDKITFEIRERTVYHDDVEEMVLSVKF